MRQFFVDLVFLHLYTGRFYRGGPARHFTFLYEATASALDEVELENAVT